MPRHTSAFSMSIAVTATKVLDRNPYRLLYSIQNLDTTNFIAIGPKRDVVAGVYDLHEGQHLAAGQPMSDDTDQDEVWAIADTAACNIAVVEISTLPVNPLARELRPVVPRDRLASRLF